MADNTIKIGGELESMATGKIVAAASAILDKLKNKTQELINQENTLGIQANAEDIANLNAVVASLQQLIDATTITGGTVANAAEVFVAAIAGLNANNVQAALWELNDRTMFPLTKPNPSTFVTQASEIGYGNGSVKAELDSLQKAKELPILSNDDTTFYITDSNGNVIAKLDDNGLSTTDVKVKQNNTLVSVLSLLANKIDKVTGKGLSTEDFTTALKNSLLSLSALSPLIPVLTELSESLNPSLADGLYVTDNNGNIIAKLSADGLETTKVKASQYVDENGESIIPEPTPSGVDGIYKNYPEYLYICDANGYVAAKYSANGLEVIEVKAKKYKDADGEEITGGDNRFAGWEMFTIGDSLCKSGAWQATTANLLGCTFDQSKNQKSGANLSTGGTSSFGTGFDITPWRVKNLIDEAYIQGTGSKALVIFENVNDGVQSFDETAQPFRLQEPIEGYAYSSFNSSLLATIPSNKRLPDTCFRLTTINRGKNLAITQLPTAEGDVKISVGWAGPGIQDYYIHVEPKATDEATLQDILEKILEYNYTGVTDTLADDEESVDFSTGNNVYAVTLAFTDTGNTGMRVSITDTNNAKGSRAKYFIGDSPKILTLSGSNIGSGSFELNINWGNKNSATVLTIPVTAQSTDQETIASIISAVCSQTVTGVSITAGTNNSIILQKTDTTHSSLTLSLSNVEVSGLSYSIDIGNVLDTIWENTSYWRDGMTYSEGWITAIAMLQQAYPDCKIAVASFPFLNVTQSEYLLPNGMYDVARYYKYLASTMVNRLQQYKDIAECLSIPCLDVHDNCGISISNFTQFYNLSKNVHPKQTGYVRWGETIAALVKSNF